MSSDPRYRVIRECRAEHAIPLPATAPDVDALLSAARAGVHRARLPAGEARVDAREGELVVFYPIPDTGTEQSGADSVARRKVGFV